MHDQSVESVEKLVPEGLHILVNVIAHVKITVRIDQAEQPFC